MPTTFWTGNGQNSSQVETLTVTAVATNGTLTATINGKNVTYTCTASDTTTTAATNWQALLAAASSVPPEFSEETWTNPSAGVVVATSAVAGRPFTLTTAGAGGATVTQVHTTANSSVSDVGNASNWLRSGSASLPQNGDDLVVADATIPMLYNLAALAAVQLNSYTRWQSFTGTIGLPEINPSGYFEYRPTYFQFTGPPAGVLPITLGVGPTGTGPSRERYNVGGQNTSAVIVASGPAADDYAIRFLGTSSSNVLSVVGTSVGVAMLPGEAATLASASVDGGGSLALGAGCTFSGLLKLIGSSAVIFNRPFALNLQDGSSIVVNTMNAAAFSSLTLTRGSIATWLSNVAITSLSMLAGSRLDKGSTLLPSTIVSGSIEGDCVINDPNSTITYTYPILVSTAVVSGPFVTGGGRSIQVI